MEELEIYVLKRYFIIVQSKTTEIQIRIHVANV